MSKRRAIIIRSAGITMAMVAVMLAAAFFLASAFLNQPHRTEKIKAGLSQAIGGDVRYDKINLALFPSPHAVLSRTAVSVPGKIRASAQSLDVYPRLFPLLRGRLLIAKIHLQEPDIRVLLPKKAEKRPDKGKAIEEIEAEMKPAISLLEAAVPGLVIQVDRGRLVLFRRNRPVVSLSNMILRFVAPPGPVEIAMKANSDSWGAVSLETTIFIDKNELAVKNLSLILGHSSLSGLSARLPLTKPHVISIASGKGSLALDELYPWFTSSGIGIPYLRDVKSLKGIVNFSSLSIEGLLAEPAGWHIKLTEGQGQKIILESTLLPAALSMSGLFSVEDNSVQVQEASLSMGKSFGSDISARVSLKGEKAFIISSGRANVALDQLFQWRSWFKGLDNLLKDIKAVRGTIKLFSIGASGTFSGLHGLQIKAMGAVDNIFVDSDLLPGALAVVRGNFILAPKKFSFNNVQAAMLDSSVTLSGSLGTVMEEMNTADVSVNGRIGPDSIRWAFTEFSLPMDLIIRPLSFSPLRIVWTKASRLALAGKLIVSNGPAISLDLSKTPRELAIHQIIVKDQDSDATLHYVRGEKASDFSFSGALAQATLVRVFEQAPGFGRGKIQGTLRGTIRNDKPMESSVKGKLTGYDFVFPSSFSLPLRIDTFLLRANKNIFTIDSSTSTLGTSHFSVTGDVSVSNEGYVLNIDLSADQVNINEVQQALSSGGRKAEQRKEQKPEAEPKARRDILGMVQFQSSSVVFGDYTFSPVKGIATVGPAGVSAAIIDGQLCGVSTPGSVSFFHGEIQADFKPSIKKQELVYSISCLTGLNVHITGNYDLDAEFSMRGASGAPLVPSLEGRVDFKARNGKIYRYPALAKIFSVLSITEIFRGKMPVIGGSGFPYKSLAVKGNIHQGKLTLEQAYIGGSSVDIIAEGEIDIAQKKMDVVVLVAPFSTINWVIRHIPVIGKALGGTLISIPVKVSGDIANPDVVFLDPATVGSKILDLFKNIVNLPVRIISPLFSKEKK